MHEGVDEALARALDRETQLVAVDAVAGTVGLQPHVEAGGGLVKLGTGTVTLAGANTYTGTTRIAAGTLAVAGTLASATLQVDAGTLALGGAERLADGATVTVAAGALMTL
ncbi:MAG: autotransporter-associated beta strand repeat-containing protein, partial [Gemmatimonas sp.]